MAEDATGVPQGAPSTAQGGCDGCAIRHSSLCSALTSDEIGSLNRIARRRVLAAGDTHVFAGDVSHSFSNVTKGVAKLVRGSADGRSQIVGLLFPSDFIGGAFSGDRTDTVPYSIEAVSPVELCVFPKRAFEGLLHDYPALEFKLLKRTLSELQISREWMVLLGRKTAQERVATFLLHVADKMQTAGCDTPDNFDLPLSRSDIADYLGLTLETVSRQMSRLRKDGIVRMDGTKRVTVLDEAQLRALAAF